MPITKRKLPKRKKTVPQKFLKSPQRRKHEKLCDELTRLVNNDNDDDMRNAMRQITTIDCSAYIFVEEIMSRASTEVTTLQVNGTYARGATYRCVMTYTDRTKEPKYGYLYPTKTVVKTSTRLIHAVILTYIELCKHIGRFI